MKHAINFVILFLFCITSFSQKLDLSITNLANDITQKVTKKNIVRLALTDFVNGDGKVDALTNYIRQELETKLINADNLQVIDRKHIKLLLSDNKLESEGLINESVAKSSSAFIKVDAWVLAEITYLGEQVKIKITVIDVTTSLMYAAASSELIDDIAIKNLLDPEEKVCSMCGGKGVVQTQTTCTACAGKGSIVCKDCNGTGKRSGMTVGSYITCEGCNGRGRFTCNGCSGNGKIITYKTCPKCNGKVLIKSSTATQSNSQGKVEICPDCLGAGKMKTEVSCNSCGGTGRAPFGPASNWENKPCKACSGKGTKVLLAVCTRCNGTGKL